MKKNKPINSIKASSLYMRKWRKAQRAQRPLFDFSRCLASHMRYIIRTCAAGSMAKRSKFTDWLGYSPAEFLGHIVSNLKPGMTLQNYGRTWELDHYVPLSYALTEAKLKAVWQLENIQPATVAFNRRKYNKLPAILTA